MKFDIKMTKSELFSKFRFLPSPELRETINNIIAENRNLPLDKAKLKKYLRPNEVLKVKQHFGIETA